MAYATDDFYRNVYRGPDGGVEFLSRASDDIDMQVVRAINVSALCPEQRELLAKATCAQAEGYVLNGDPDNIAEGSVSLGSFSISSGGAKKVGKLYRRASDYLFLAGLANRTL